MRAISRGGDPAASALTRVATRFPLSSASFEISKCWFGRAPRPAARVTAITCSAREQRQAGAQCVPRHGTRCISRIPAWALNRDRQHDLSARQEPRSSPPEATFINGPAFVRGLVWTQNSMRFETPGGPATRIGFDLVANLRARAQRRQFGIDGLVELLRRLGGAPESWSRRCCRPCPLAPLPLELFQLIGAGIDQRHVRRRIAERAGRRPASSICASGTLS